MNTCFSLSFFTPSKVTLNYVLLKSLCGARQILSLINTRGTLSVNQSTDTNTADLPLFIRRLISIPHRPFSTQRLPRSSYHTGGGTLGTGHSRARNPSPDWMPIMHYNTRQIPITILVLIICKCKLVNQCFCRSGGQHCSHLAL